MTSTTRSWMLIFIALAFILLIWGYQQIDEQRTKKVLQKQAIADIEQQQIRGQEEFIVVEGEVGASFACGQTTCARIGSRTVALNDGLPDTYFDAYQGSFVQVYCRDEVVICTLVYAQDMIPFEEVES